MAVFVEVNHKDPLAYCLNKSELALEIVHVPLVTVQAPAPRFTIFTKSPVASVEVLAVIVVALALFIVIMVPLSAATNEYEAVFGVIVQL